MFLSVINKPWIIGQSERKILVYYYLSTIIDICHQKNCIIRHLIFCHSTQDLSIFQCNKILIDMIEKTFKVHRIIISEFKDQMSTFSFQDVMELDPHSG